MRVVLGLHWAFQEQAGGGPWASRRDTGLQSWWTCWVSTGLLAPGSALLATQGKGHVLLPGDMVIFGKWHRERLK